MTKEGIHVDSIVMTAVSTDAASVDRPFGMSDLGWSGVGASAFGTSGSDVSGHDGPAMDESGRSASGAPADDEVRLRAEDISATCANRPEFSAQFSLAFVSPSFVDVQSFYPYRGSDPTWSSSR